MPESAPPVEGSLEIPALTEQLFREESGRLVATLTRHFGLAHLQLAEDVVQEAHLRALRVWPETGVPRNPAGWLMQTAKHLALDVLRRGQNFAGKEAAIIASIEAGQTPAQAPREDEEISDDRLRLLFVCCHPYLALEAQVALALRTLCGLSTLEIAHALLTHEATIAKRLTRAKQRLRDGGIRFEIPLEHERASRLDAVLQTLYLLFSEGYKASGGERLVREELCAEAIRLMALLVERPVGREPRARALLALMLFHAARLPARIDPAGQLLLLEEQDRRLWDAALIARGLEELAASASGSEVTVYHLQAGIAACHCSARDDRATDWRQILAFYDRLLTLDNSPIVALNRAIAIAKVSGPAAGLAALDSIEQRDKLESYHLLHATLGDLRKRAGDLASARQHYRDALQHAETRSEQDFLRRRLAECESMSDGDSAKEEPRQ